MTHDDHADDITARADMQSDAAFNAKLETMLPTITPNENTDAFASLSQTSVDADALADMQTYSNLQEKRKKAKRKKAIKIVITCVVLAIILVGGTLWFINSMAADSAVDMEPQTAFVEQGLFLDDVSASGQLKPISSVIAAPEVEGIVGEVWVSEGDTVTAGQALYSIVNNDLDKAITQAQQGINEANNNVTSAQIALEDARRARQMGIDAAAANPEEAFDVGGADSAIRQAELALASAWNALTDAQTNYDDAVARAAKRTVTSPINGSIVAVNIEPGTSLAGAGGASEAIPVQIADLSSMLVSVEVNEVDILKVKVDQTATLSFSAIPDLELTGVVRSIATVNTGAGADMSMGSSGTVTYAVEIFVESPDERLKPGMSVRASVESQRIENALMVPLSAVTPLSATEGIVLVVDPDDPENIKEVTVEILASNGLTMAVKGKISAGDELLITGDGGLAFDEGNMDADAGAVTVSVG